MLAAWNGTGQDRIPQDILPCPVPFDGIIPFYPVSYGIFIFAVLTTESCVDGMERDETGQDREPLLLMPHSTGQDQSR